MLCSDDVFYLIKALYEAVVDGNIDLVDDLLDLPSADINMEWVGIHMSLIL